ncbi:MAG: glycosyltransferase [Actinomycetota bacterium]
MTDVPDEVERLAQERQEARQRKEFERADALRERIRELGFDVVDGPEGPVMQRLASETEPAARRVRPADVAPLPVEDATFDVSVQWVVQGWPEDAVRGIEAVRGAAGARTVQYVVVDAADTDPDVWPEGVDVIMLDEDPGWGLARNVGLRRAAGGTVVVIDGSVEPTGDVLGPIEHALEDPSVGLVGPFGIVTDDLREFRPSDGPDVDAIEGYLMAFRREAIAATGGFDEKFKFYRTADIEFSFRLKDQGLRTCVVPLPVTRHEHRLWAATPADRRDALSKRNFYRFLDRWRGRTDLTEAGKGKAPA